MLLSSYYGKKFGHMMMVAQHPTNATGLDIVLVLLLIHGESVFVNIWAHYAYEATTGGASSPHFERTNRRKLASKMYFLGGATPIYSAAT